MKKKITKSHSKLCIWTGIQTGDLHSSADQYINAFGLNFEPCGIRTKRMCPALRIPQKNVHPLMTWAKRHNVRVRLFKYKYLIQWNLAFLICQRSLSSFLLCMCVCVKPECSQLIHQSPPLVPILQSHNPFL
jgi:hypothetical protein